jgi:glycosyltransferase involved in cell wall biosynthesis
MSKLYVIMPAFNEAAMIGSLIRRLLSCDFPGASVAALVVDDGSTDGTGSRARDAGALTVVHPRNLGVGAALRSGLARARKDGADYMAHIDADGQLLPEELPRLFSPVRSGDCDLAVGSRFLPGQPPPRMASWRRNTLAGIARGVGLLTGYPLTDISCGMRCMNRKVMDVMRPSFDYDYIQETLLQALACRVVIREFPVTAQYGAEHEGGLSQDVLRYGGRFVLLTAHGLVQFAWTRGASTGA